MSVKGRTKGFEGVDVKLATQSLRRERVETSGNYRLFTSLGKGEEEKDIFVTWGGLLSRT